MPTHAEDTLIIDDFPGLINNSDARDVPPGAAQVLVNMCPRIPGQMQSRRGLQLVGFEQVTTVAIAPTD